MKFRLIYFQMLVVIVQLALAGFTHFKLKAETKKRYFQITFSFTHGDTLSIMHTGTFMSSGSPTYDDMADRIKNKNHNITSWSIDSIKELSLSEFKADTATVTITKTTEEEYFL